MTPHEVGFTLAGVGAFLALASLIRLPLAVSQRQRAALSVQLTDAQGQLFIGKEYAGHLTRERDQARKEAAMLREVLRHCTCASSKNTRGDGARGASGTLRRLGRIKGKLQ